MQVQGSRTLPSYLDLLTNPVRKQTRFRIDRILSLLESFQVGIHHTFKAPLVEGCLPGTKTILGFPILLIDFVAEDWPEGSGPP